MRDLKLKLMEIRDRMPYGKLKALAQSHGVNYTKARNIMSGRVEITQSEEAFIYECFDLAKERKKTDFKKLTPSNETENTNQITWWLRPL